MKLHKLAAVLAFGLWDLFAPSPVPKRPKIARSGRSRCRCRKRRSTISAVASRNAVARSRDGRRPVAGHPAREAQAARRILGQPAYDWRKAEAKLNALPQFMTTIDGVDIHFIHVRSKHPNALPLIMTHGWPGSVLELLKTVGPLTDPTAHGGSAGGCVRPRPAVACRASASPASRRTPAGVPTASREPGRS